MKLTITPYAELDAPTNVLAQDETESSFKVSWDHAQAEIDGYVLTYSSSEGSSEEMPVGSDSTSYILTGLKPGVLYTVYVWAIKGDKSSRKSSTQAETGLRSRHNVIIIQYICLFIIIKWMRQNNGRRQHEVFVHKQHSWLQI